MALRLGDLAINDLMLGTARVQKVFLGTYQVWVNEIVVVLGARSVHTYLKSLFPADVWVSPRRKRVVIPQGVEVGTASAFAIAVSEASEVQADSWVGDLIVDIRGIVSGIGGAANSGAGGDVIRVNLPGRDGQKLMINLYDTGTLRAGGGGGGKAGNGGAGNYLVETFSGWQFQWRDIYNVSRNPAGTTTQYFWNGTAVYTGSDDTGSVIVGSYRYVRGTYQHAFSGWSIYQIGRYTRTFPATAGGVAGAPGRGQGFDGAATNGAAAVGGGTGAGASGKSGNGGGWGAAGQAGTAGAAGNVGGGTAGAPGGLSGFYLNGAANCNFNNSGTVLGRVA